MYAEEGRERFLPPSVLHILYEQVASCVTEEACFKLHHLGVGTCKMIRVGGWKLTIDQIYEKLCRDKHRKKMLTPF